MPSAERGGVGEVALLVFLRAPTPGHTKTRLMPALGARGAATLYAAFVEDTLRCVAEVPELRLERWVASAADAAVYPDARVQSGEDLGARMSHALDDALTRAERALLIGSDCPTLPPAHLRAAVRALDEHDVVLGPSADGGYYLIGARARAPDLRSGVRWSSPHTRADTLARVAPRRVAQLRPWYDVDTPEDLRLLRLHVALRPGAAPASARVLSDFDRSTGA